MATKLKAKAPALTVRRKPQVLVYGKSGVGKTWTALDFPSCYYIDVEKGATEEKYKTKLETAGGVYLGVEDGALDFKEVIGQVQALATEKHEYKTLIIDSISKLFNATVGLEQERLGDKDQYGASKKAPVAYMRRLINWLSRLDMNVLLVAHEKEEYGLTTNKSGEQVREVVGYTYDCWDRLEYELDLVMRITMEGPRRTARVRKSRIDGFDINKGYEWSLAEFASRYGLETINRQVVAVTLATPEQVAEISRLVGLLNVQPEETDKWLSKAGAENFSEFSLEQATKILEFLNAKIQGRAA